MQIREVPEQRRTNAQCKGASSYLQWCPGAIGVALLPKGYLPAVYET